MNTTLLLTMLGPLLAGPSASPAEEPVGRVLLAEDFDDDTRDGLAKRLLSHRHIALAEGEGADGSNAIRVEYVGIGVGSDRVVALFPISEPVERATLSFDVCFEDDFQWTLGGKLHGLGPDRVISGGQDRRPEGWSGRVTFRKDGGVSTYLYDQDSSRKYGRSTPAGSSVFERGRWHQVALEVALNEPGRADGVARLLIDGKEVVHDSDVEYRGEGGDQTLIRRFLFSTFHGGSDDRWTPIDEEGNPTTVHALFDNVLVTEGGFDDR